MQPSAELIRFVRGLTSGQVATCTGRHYVQPDGRRAGASIVERLVQAGAVAGDGQLCSANRETASWLKRALLDADGFAAQHRLPSGLADGTEINLAESPLARLAATPSGGTAFLERHHLEAGERVRRLIERAQLRPRLTMNYADAPKAKGGPIGAGEISDMAADARRALDELHRILPSDCAGVIVDVCGMFKGLQDVERDRGWPRRSAKLVLRIGLEQLAQHFGLGPFATGPVRGEARSWMDTGARPERFG